MKAHGQRGQELRITPQNAFDELQEYLRDDANEIDEASQQLRSGGDCAEHKLLGVWLDKKDTQPPG